MSSTCEVFIDPEWGGFAKTRYQVRAGGLSYFPIVDQSRARGWTSLGAFLFEAGDGQFVRIFDNAERPLEGDLHIVADALRVVPLHVDGCERLPSSGGVIRETSLGAGRMQYVKVADTSLEPVVSGERRIAVDAIRLSPAP
jgi:hypothetical protein